MESFSDGVFAVAITLLVLDLAIHPPGSPLEQVLDAWPSYVAYVVSFLTIGAAWLGHTALTDRLKQVDPVLLRINLLLLMVVTLLPFPTHLVAEALTDGQGERVFVTLYGLTLLTIRLLGLALDAYARRERLYSQERDQEGEVEVDGGSEKLIPVLIGYAIALILGLTLPTVAVCFYAAVAVYLIVPFGEISRVMFRHRRERSA